MEGAPANNRIIDNLCLWHGEISDVHVSRRLQTREVLHGG
jgi:hypothetical protein